MTSVYFDNAATTQMRDEVVNRMSEVMKSIYGNPSSTHAYGRQAKSLIESCRKQIAKTLNVTAAEIFFTSGGTEADNLILRGAVRDLGVTRIISSKIEHHAVLHTIDALVSEYGIKADFVNVNSNGQVDVEHLETLLQESSVKTLVSLMHINNEVGTILDLPAVAALCKQHQALFHSDTVQSVGHYHLDLQEVPADFIVASAHKFHGPKGIGFAFVRKNSGLRSSIHGGQQERGLRAGTESVHNIVGLEESFKLAYEHLEEEKKYIQKLKDYFIAQLEQQLPGVGFNGDCSKKDHGTYTLLNVCLPFAKEKSALLQFQLDLKGIACSKGSACQSGSSQNSHVLTELLDDEHLARPSVRFSFSKYNTKEEIDYVVNVLREFSEN